MSKKKRRKAEKRMAEAYAQNMQRAMMGTMNGNQRGMMRGLTKLLPSGRTEQFLVGALVGAGVAYVLSDDELRSKLMKSGARLYASVMGNFAEMKEQMEDAKAEIDAEREGAA